MWRIKILIKLVLARLPISYNIWKRLKIFRHGGMSNSQYSYDTITKHFEQLKQRNPVAHPVCLELGPGDSAASAVIAFANGAAKTYLVDAGAFIAHQVSVYSELLNYMRAQKKITISPIVFNTMEEYFAQTHSEYLTEGLKSLKTIPSQSVDYIWSQAVLEHVRLSEFGETMRELKRILKPNGWMSHRVDLQDHLQHSLNNLRFSKKLWESDFFAKSGFYTNRIRYRQMVKYIEEAGFFVEVTHLNKWDKPPLPRAKMNVEFRDLSEEELCVFGFNILARA